MPQSHINVHLQSRDKNIYKLLFSNGIFLLFFSVFAQNSLFSQNLDIRILRSLNSSPTLSSDKFFQFASNSDVYVVLGIPTAMAAVGLLKHDNKILRNSCVTFASTALCAGITSALKYSIKRVRPFITYPDITKKSAAGSPSFPSGHTSSAFATAMSISLSYPKWYIIVPVYTWAGTVAYSRMDLGVHYPSDVLGGAIIGAGSAWLTYYVNKKLIINSKKRSSVINY
jgi:membrane-associated phospholipid phosphatase